MESVKLKQQLITYLEEEKVHLTSDSTTNAQEFKLFHMKYYDVKEDLQLCMCMRALPTACRWQNSFI